MTTVAVEAKPVAATPKEVKYDASKLPSLESQVSWIGYVFFTHLDKLFNIGYVKPLDYEDLGGIPESNKSGVLYERFEKFFELEKKKPEKKHSLWNVLWLTVGYGRLYWALILFGIYAALLFGPVLILTRLVRYFSGLVYYSKASLWVMVALLFIFPMVGSLASSHSNAIMANIGAQVRNTLINIIYRKSLVISPYSKQFIGTGKIITMFSDDTNQIRNFLFFLNNSVLSPLQIGACLYLIYQQVGVATFVGLGYSVVVTPITGIVFGIVFKMRREKMVFTDSRVKIMNEVLNGIRIIKYYAWENAFVKKISEIRAMEIHYLAKMGYIFNAVFALLLLGAPQIQTVLIFFTYIATGHQLDAAKAFTTLTLFGLMTTPFIFLPFGLQQYSQSLVSTKRIYDFLMRPELEPYIEHVDEAAMGDKETLLEFENCDVSWVPLGAPEEEEAAKKQEEEAAKAEKAEGGKGYKSVDSKDKEADIEQGKLSRGISERSGVNRAIMTLRGLNFSVKRGELVAVVGSVGSGKSSLLSAILGEMHLRNGAIKVAGKPRIAFCDQRPWIVNDTVKGNVLFGNDYDETRFNQALFAACMYDDIKILPAGIATEIGERGINLSGGQKARVALARAVYDDADLVLLDDPLSAVDAHVGEHIFHKCIKETLHGKTVILVTHHLHVLSQCDQVIILDDDGTVKAAGSYKEILRSGVDVEKYLAKKEEEPEEGSEKAPVDEAVAVAELAEAEKARARTVSADKPRSKSDTRTSGKESSKKDKPSGELITQEDKNEGNVSLKTYTMYIAFGGVMMFILTIFGQLCTQALQVYSGFWLADWGKETSIGEYTGNEMSEHRSFYWLHGYAGMQIGSVATLFISRIALTAHRTAASKNLHNAMLSRLLYFPVAFFDVTPVGRIINRFSQDMATIDEDLAQTMSQVISMVAAVLGSIGAIAGSTKGTVLLLFIPLGFLYYRFMTFFRRSNTEIARLEATSRSPIYADFSQTLSGTSTVRAYKQQERFTKNLEMFANNNTVPGVLQQIAGQWLGIRLDFLGSLIMFFMGALTVSTRTDGFIPAGYLALGLSYSIQITAMLKMAVRVSATLEAQFNSVDRIKYYIEAIPVEEEDDPSKTVADQKLLDTMPGNAFSSPEQYRPAPTGEGDIELAERGQVVAAGAAGGPKQYVIPPAEWPQQGAIEFKDVQMRYRKGPLVLKGVSFNVNPHDKIGIAGRTGCGKSSLMVALFRIEELVQGQIIIDGIDISKIHLQLLRSKLCIIPQDPVMFSASVRFNLDPFDQCTDEQVWNVLRDVNLTEHIQSLPNKLAEMVAEGGDNFSAGQRQLICIARALLRKPKILILDEATASIDSETDNFIQSMIREKFADCTVLTIAHRLHTIRDSTKVLVMDAGHVGEYDAPDTLLATEGGIFKALWDRHVAEGGQTDTGFADGNH